MTEPTYFTITGGVGGVAGIEPATSALSVR
jgi:hypothetical protein